MESKMQTPEKMLKSPVQIKLNTAYDWSQVYDSLIVRYPLTSAILSEDSKNCLRTQNPPAFGSPPQAAGAAVVNHVALRNVPAVSGGDLVIAPWPHAFGTLGWEVAKVDRINAGECHLQSIALDTSDYDVMYTTFTDQVNKRNRGDLTILATIDIESLKTSTGDSNLNHISGCFEHGGSLYVVAESYTSPTVFSHQHIIRITTSTFTYSTSWTTPQAQGHECSGCCWYNDGTDRIVISEYKTAGPKLWIYNLADGVYQSNITLSGQATTLHQGVSWNATLEKFYISCSGQAGIYEATEAGVISSTPVFILNDPQDIDFSIDDDYVTTFLSTTYNYLYYLNKVTAESYMTKYSIGMWVWRDERVSQAHHDTIFAIPGTQSFLFRNKGGGVTKLAFWNGGTWYESTVDLELKRFYRILMTVENGGDIKFYVDGELVYTGDFSAGTLAAPSNSYDWLLQFGQGNSYAEGLTGYFDGINIYDDVLSAEQVKSDCANALNDYTLTSISRVIEYASAEPNYYLVPGESGSTVVYTVGDATGYIFLPKAQAGLKYKIINMGDGVGTLQVLLANATDYLAIETDNQHGDNNGWESEEFGDIMIVEAVSSTQWIAMTQGTWGSVS